MKLDRENYHDRQTLLSMKSHTVALHDRLHECDRSPENLEHALAGMLGVFRDEVELDEGDLFLLDVVSERE